MNLNLDLMLGADDAQPGNGPGPGPGDLLAELTAAAGTAPTALWIPGVETFSDGGGTPAADEDSAAVLNDQVADSHMAQDSTNPVPLFKTPKAELSGIETVGSYSASDTDTDITVTDASDIAVGDLLRFGVLPTANQAEVVRVTSKAGNVLTVTRAHPTAFTEVSIGDGAAVHRVQCGSVPYLSFTRRVSTQGLICANDLASLLSAERGTIAILAVLVNTASDSGTATFRPAMINTHDNTLYPSFRQRDATTRSVTGHVAGGGADVSTVNTLTIPTVYSSRYDRTVPNSRVAANKTVNAAGTAPSDQVLDKTLKFGAGSGGLGQGCGLLGPVATWDVDLTDEQLFAVVDVLRAYAGLDPVADPE